MLRISFLLFSIVSAPVSAEDSHLSPDGKRMESEHRYLFKNYLAKYPSTLIDPEAPMGKRTLKSVLLAKPDFTSMGKFELPLPTDTEKVIQFFRYIELRGEHLDQLTSLRLLPAAPHTDLHISVKNSSVYRVKIPSFLPPGAAMPSLRLTSSGESIIQEIHLITHPKGVSEQFDQLPYLNLGHDKAPIPVKLNLDPCRLLSISGHTQLDRSKWFRYYGKPTSLPTSIEQWAIDRNFYPGRQMFKIAPSLERGYGNPKKIILTEDPDKPGHPHPEFEDKLKPDTFRDITKTYSKDYKFAMCLDEWPSFQSHPTIGRGTPRIEYFNQAAQLAATYFKKQIEHSGRTATWWEVKNESTIKSEWSYHFSRDKGQPVDSWKHLADFHNLVADTVHQSTPEVKIGGPTSAWMQLQVANFLVWKNQARFMDLTKDHLDFYSHHFYENAHSIGAEKRLSSGYDSYLLGRLETLLDMFEAYGEATNNRKPMIISEYGTLNTGTSDADYWERLRAYSAYLTRFMQRPDQLDLAVPFIFLASPWAPTSGQSTFIPNNKRRYSNNIKDYQLTPCQHFFNLWRDFQGHYLYSPSTHRYLETVAVRKGKTIHIALSNMSSDRLSVDLGHILKTHDIKNIFQRRLYRIDGKIRYQDMAPVSHSEIPLEAEETSVVIIQLADNPPPRQALNFTKHYARNVVEHIDFETALSINITEEKLAAEHVTLYIGLHRAGGLPTKIPLSFNGKKFTINTEYATHYKEFFSTLKISIPTTLLKIKNQLHIQLPEQATLTSTHLSIGQP
jgi:hypothetical protein